MKYTLIAEDEFGGSTTTREFQADYLPDVLSEVELFLRGAGFFFEGNLDFVNDFETEPEWDTPQDFSGDGHDGMGSTLADYENHSEFYFDTQRNK
jgi:hypothetical protein